MRQYVDILPKNEKDAHSAGDPSEGKSAHKYRRVGVSVACNSCRRRKVRCDGKRPNCSNCEGSDEPCTYRDESDLSQESQLLLLEVFRLLNALPDEQIIRKLRGLRKEIDASAILSALRQSEDTEQQPPNTSSIPIRSPSVSGASSRSSHPEYIPGRMPRFCGYERILWPLGAYKTEPSSGTWTNITDDMSLVYHLFALYFCWEYPLFAPFSKEAFLKDFQDGRHRYCSPLLVNAVLALGCRMSAISLTKANAHDFVSLGARFFDEAARLLDQETDLQSLTTIQALGILSLREISCGRDLEALYYSRQELQLAIEMGLHRKDKKENRETDTFHSVRSSTFWGAFALNNSISVLSLANGSLPQHTHLSSYPPKPVVVDDVEASLWVPYTDDGSPLESADVQPSNVLTVYKCFCGLSEIIYDSLLIIHSPVKLLTAESLIKVYTRYLEWYNDVPEVLRLGYNSTPTVLFTHMCYHFAILHLFRPFVKLQISGSEILPRDVCQQAADAMQGLLRSYSQLYTLHRTPSLVPILTLASAICHFKIRPIMPRAHASQFDTGVETIVNQYQHVSETFWQDVADLEEMATCHRSAKQALNVLGYIGKATQIDKTVETQSVSVDDYDRLVKPYVERVELTSHRVRRHDFLIDS